MRNAILSLLAFAAGAASAQSATPVGTWQTVDDKTGEPKSIVVIADQGGTLSGRVQQLLRKGADPAARCTECTDDRKDQPLVGLEIIRGAKKAEGRDVWEDGRILDPENGKTYALRLTPADGGRKLDVRGSIGPFGRTQTWTRVP
ncbi:DUF2147 domain-containing protein [Xylophilus sp.]|uniref:DUF2147 domain-containing protein n=1 Tax=Xylophilus sp. TaxID=2653893 RepID=UPI0013B64995|nr:DUF2147 domain-containing protein [Xylophilus sp.]KAF1043949.1 MAG: hypothetical protein GAK38_03746 [Xylophilus sp.]